ncbi:hypothetical protein PsYK624_011220 [Phanerochaete sordida]|uniref:F-box domain-containing protein n=1 Tax=Phanerochaete sordida TaxID=48140 RepID=A0A9P3L7J8_9APHY|nr:hypothetical protein PsYK624_011220 [Phanerochaete sordida]
MHLCLAIGEVVERIADHIFDPPVDRAGVLVPMALVSCAFRDAALSVVWRDLDNLSVLYYVLPARVLSRVNDLYTVTQPLNDQEWRRFLWYTAKIRSIGSVSPYDIVQSKVVNIGLDWDSVMRYHPGDRLLPNLEAVHCSEISTPGWLPQFIRPPLRELTIRFPEPWDATPLLEACRSCAGTMAHFEYSPPSLPRVSVEAETLQAERVSQAILSFEVLRTLIVPQITPEAFRHIGSLSSLKQLTTRLPEGFQTPANIPFHSLEHLELSYESLDAAPLIILLTHTAAPGLTELQIAHTRRGPPCSPSPAGTLALLHLLPKFTSLHSLTLLAQHGEHFDLNELSQPEHALTALAPLLALRHLTHLDLRDTHISPTPVELDAIIGAWPHIATLRLGDDAHDGAPTLQLEDLLPFALRCARLEALGLRVAVDGEKEYGEGMPSGESQSGVRYLWLGALTGPGSYRGAVRYIESLFPDALVHPSASFRTGDEAWRAMNELMAYSEGDDPESYYP